MGMRRTDLPLDRDGIGRFLPWLIAFMVYLAAVALAGALALDGLAGRWDKGVNATLTVQIPAAADPKVTDGKVAQVLRLLETEPSVEYVEPLDDDSLMRLVGPWLGPPETLGDLPLPRLIDVRMRAGSDFDFDDLARRIRGRVPGAAVDNHQVWLDRMIRLMRTVQGTAVAVVALIALAMGATVVFATRTGLAIHHDVIEVLHLTGARDSYVAGQFGGRALLLGIKGGILGLLLAAPTLFGLGWMVEYLGGQVIPSLSLDIWDWALLAMLPLASGLASMVTARHTVTRALRRMF